MNMNNKRPVMITVLLLSFCTALVSFAPKFGGEGFQVYVNNKLVLERFGSQLDLVKTLPLDEYSANGQVTVKYFHCGRIGKSRVITIKDDEKKILKQWKFADVTEPVAAMNCSVKEIIDLRKNTKNNTLNLYYTSTELPGGRLLASFRVDNATAAKVAP